MSNHTDEVISAFVDNETSGFEARLSIKEMLQSDEQRTRWERYHVIRDALRGNLPATMDTDFTTEVMARIEAEPTATAQGSARRSHQLLRPVGGLALAAVVAVVSVLALRSMRGTESAPSAQTIAQTEARDEAARVSEPEVPIPISPLNTPAARARMNSYLVNHAEYATAGGVMPYARVFGYHTH
jgi:sigma-E factor negative regulatory protein RseA